MNEDDQPTFEIEHVEEGALEIMQRAEIDCQITTAKRYPRSLSKVKRKMLDFATLDEETAESCFYTLPRGGKHIQGPSIRLAEIAVSCYQNVRAGARVVNVVTTGDNPHVEIQAVCHDLENNVCVTIPKRRRIFKKRNRDAPDEDDINLAANAGSAIAFRDAVFKVVPMALVKPVFEAAKRVAIGDASTLNARRGKCLDTFAKMGVGQEMVLLKLGVENVDDIGVSHLETLIGLHNAIKDGQINIDDAFAVDTPKTEVVDDDEGKKADKAKPAKAEKPKLTLVEQEFTPQEQLEQIVTSGGFTFDNLLKWGEGTGNMEPKEIEKMTSFDDVPTDLAVRLVRSKVGLLKGLKGGK